jgi:hypothetical protein
MPMCAQAVLRHAGDVLAVDQMRPPLQVVEAQQQVHQRALARAAAAHQADLLAGRMVRSRWSTTARPLG